MIFAELQTMEWRPLATGAIVGLATAGVVIRPFGWPEAVWAVGGAAVLVMVRLLAPLAAWHGIFKGRDVYLFLTGMMALAAVARREGLFDWLASHAVRRADGSAPRLFALVYGVGIVVTTFLSNDATAVVLTPAVYAAARAAKVEPLPYLLICALIANAASFVLPISNPANLVVFAARMPPLATWLARFALPSALAIAVTYAVLRVSQRARLRAPVERHVEAAPLTAGGAATGLGIVLTGAVLIASSAFGVELGLPTFLAGLATTAAVLAIKREGPLATVSDIAWGVIPLVAGLFVLVEALEATGALAALAGTLKDSAARSPILAGALGGTLVAFGCNLANNLPAGLLAGAAVQAAGVDDHVAGAILVGIDLGPNLSVTGSLATILWLAAIRREGEEVGFLAFLRIGMMAMPPALAAALAALLLLP